MSQPDVDSELERLLSHTRAETEPSRSARARIRAALEARLAAPAAPPPWIGRAKLVGLLGAVGLVVGLGVWRWRAPAPAPLVEMTPAVPSTNVAPLTTPPEPRPEPVSVTAPSAPEPAPSHAALVAPARPVAPVTDPRAELELIAAMQAALRSGNAALALARAEEHAKRFPRGALVEEREGVRAVARCRLAEPGARAAVEAAFLKRYASSPYAARVRDACR